MRRLLFYIFPLFLFGIVMRIILFSEAVLVFSTILGVAAAFIVDNSLPIFVYVFLGNLVASYFSGQVEKRSTMLGAGFFSALIMSFVMCLFHGLLGHPFAELPLTVGLILLGGRRQQPDDGRPPSRHRAYFRLHHQLQAP